MWLVRKLRERREIYVAFFDAKIRHFILIFFFFLLGRLRKPLEKLRPFSVTELLLSNDGDQMLEGCVTNFFVVCRKVSG